MISRMTRIDDDIAMARGCYWIWMVGLYITYLGSCPLLSQGLYLRLGLRVGG